MTDLAPLPATDNVIQEVMASRQDTSSLGSRRSGGRNVGQFVIDKEIGKGSFAQVYMGWQKVRYPLP